MIGRICGVIVEKQPPELLLDVNGVGYELQTPLSAFYRLPATGQQVVLHTHFVVREDAQQLFGFLEREERALFRTLIRVTGIGPKLALAILSGMETDDFVRCVQRGDSGALVRIPGVGKKTADRLIVEVRDRLSEWQPAVAAAAARTAPATPADDRNRMVQDAESALISLGYKPQEAARAVSGALTEDVEESGELIRRALKSMLPAR